MREALARRGPFSARDAVRVLHDVLDALSYAHQRGVIHRDIKPGNILTHGTHALVTDFGVAKALSASMPHSGTTSGGIAIGTPAYMAPEQLAADPHADHRMDLYAVGLLAYELLSAEQPFSESSPAATMAAQLTRMPKPLAEVRPDVPPPLAALITRLLSKHPDQRPPTATAALTELEEMITPQGGVMASTGALTPAGAMAASAATPAPTPAATISRAFPRRAVFTTAGVVVAAVAAALLLKSDDPQVPAVVQTPRPESIASSPQPQATPPAAGAVPNDKGAARAGGTGSRGGSAVIGGDTAQAKLPPGRSGTGAGSAGASAPKAATAPTTTAPPPIPARGAAAPPRRPAAPPRPVPTFERPRKVAVLPVRDVTMKPELAPLARALEDSTKSALAAGGYTLASDADLVRLLASNDMNQQRSIAEGMGIGAVVTTILQMRGADEIIAQSIVLDVWRAMPQSVRDEGEMADPSGALGVVRDVVRSMGRVTWRQRNDPRRVVVFDLENQTGADSLNTLALAVGDSLRRVAVSRASLEVVGDPAARATRGTEPRREVGQRLGAGAIVAGILSRRGSDSVRVRITVRDMTEERTFETLETVAPITAPFPALGALLDRYAADLGRVNWGPRGIPGRQ